jgi:hypothetical protein
MAQLEEVQKAQKAAEEELAKKTSEFAEQTSKVYSFGLFLAWVTHKLPF